MNAKEISEVKINSPKFASLLLSIRNKDPIFTRDYLYWCAWREILNNNEIVLKNKFKTLETFMKEIPIKVEFDG